MNIVNDILIENCAKYGEKEALAWQSSRISYNSLREAVMRLAGGLRSVGIEKGDHVLLMLPNIPHFPIAYYAVLAVGAIVVPVNIMFKEREISYQLEDSEAIAAIGWEGFAPELIKSREKTESLKHLFILGEKIPQGTISLTKFMAQSKPLTELEEVDEEDTAVILYTAGWTGHPKGAELTHSGLLNAVKQLVDTLRFTSKEKMLAVVPFFHSFGGVVVMNAGLYGGTTLILAPRFSPAEVMDLIQKEKISIFAGVPTMFQMLYDRTDSANYDCSSLRYCLSSGSALSSDLLKKFEEKFHTYILEGYGVSETSAAACFNNFKRERKPDSVGSPLNGIEVKIVDEHDREVPIGEVGEIVIKGNTLMKGYRNRPQATTESMRNGLFHTGDIGRMDLDGYFYIVDRMDDMILKGGFKVFPREIEEVISGHPQVKEVAVVGFPENVMGEEIKACIVPKDGARINPTALLEYCRERLANYKCPRELRFFHELPKGPTGRIIRKELKR
ncbi:MAG: long-chain fatty acid--CoA ligase [FCB group bacterium]|nr:long-chain fatty acid--CoA ligase [FCB group bacterium]